MDGAGGNEQFHAGVLELEMTCLSEIEGKAGTARAVLWIAEFILTAGVVEDGEEPYHLLIRRMVAGQKQTIAPHRKPVARAMVGIGTEAETRADEIP